MGARRLRLAVVALLCGFVCVLAGGAGSAVAAAHFGESGENAGQLKFPVSLGLDMEAGDVYVPDFYNERVSKFEGSGGFLFSWGWKVNRTAPAEELQTCTAVTECRKGESGPGSGEFANSCGAQAVAVDNDPLSASYKDVYVVDFCHYRVQKFDSSGKFLLLFGGHVNEDKDNTPGASEAEKDVCVAGEACTKGTSGTVDGEFEWATAVGNIAVGPAGAVYVGDQGRVQVFEPSGAWLKNIPLTGLPGTSRVTALAVDSAGDALVKDEGVAGVRGFEPGGKEMAVRFDEGSEAVEAVTLDASGDVFVADSTGGFHVAKYAPSGKELSSFGSKVIGGTHGIVFSDTLGELYASFEASVWILASPPPGPLVEPGSEAATPGLRGAAAFEAIVNPQGNDTTYHVEYVDDAHFQSSGFASASSTSPAPVGAASEDFEDHLVRAVLPEKTLQPGVTYHWRAVATDTQGHASLGAGESFQEPPVARIEGPWATNVAATSVSLAAQIDPLSSTTDYRLEWGTSTSYGHAFSGNVGEGVGYVSVGPFHIQDIQADTTYHYRLVTSSDMGTIEGADHTFTTQIAVGELTLPDGRAWELVSPADKKAALIRPQIGVNPDVTIDAAVDGSGITYVASDAIGEGASGKEERTPLLSTRGPGGWRTADISIPYGVPVEGYAGQGENQGVVLSLAYAGDPEMLFSSDLSLAATEQHYENPAPPLSPQATERTPYLRNNLICGAHPQACYTPLVTPRDVEPPGVAFGGTSSGASAVDLKVVGATPDLSHLVLRSPIALRQGAAAGLYEWGDGELQYVGAGSLGYQGQANQDIVAHAISSDGRRIVFSRGTMSDGPIELFVRDMTEKKTTRIGGPEANYQTMSGDGSRLFYREHGELYEVNAETGAQSDLTANHGASEASAGVQDAILGSSEEGCNVGGAGECNVYFVAKGVLSGANAKGLVPAAGGYNLYMLYEDVSGWSTRYVATLSSEDQKSWYGITDIQEESEPCDCRGVSHPLVSSRVSSNGRFVSFMSNRSLTGYDNIDAISGQLDEEVYLYDAAADRLVCVSCNPTGARPMGVLDGKDALLVDPYQAWGSRGGTRGSHWLAGITPSWWEQANETERTSFYQPRFLSDGGRMFFDSPDGLVPQATNGLMNVYEYEPTGVGDCTNASGTFSERSNGCLSLISAGTSTGESDFYDASENGNDAFFITPSRLTGEDYDEAYDVYDAHICSTRVPCPVVSTVPPPCTSGDSCKAAPGPQPQTFGAPPSATFSGAGNLASAGLKSAVRPRSSTRSRMLAQALRACRKKKGMVRRSMCERLAKKRYAAGRSHKATTTRRGNR